MKKTYLYTQKTKLVEFQRNKSIFHLLRNENKEKPTLSGEQKLWEFCRNYIPGKIDAGNLFPGWQMHTGKEKTLNSELDLGYKKVIPTLSRRHTSVVFISEYK